LFSQPHFLNLRGIKPIKNQEKLERKLKINTEFHIYDVILEYVVEELGNPKNKFT